LPLFKDKIEELKKHKAFLHLGDLGD
jgi:hypothetical protein